MPWSTKRVLDITIKRCIDNNLSYKMLPLLFDIDTKEDLVRWYNQSECSIKSDTIINSVIKK